MRWLALPDIREADGKTILETRERTNAGGLANSAARLLPEGTVALSRTASVGFTTTFGREMATSQDFANWVCGPDLSPKFLMRLFMRSRARLREMASGATHKTIYMPQLESFMVCVPDCPTQERINGWLDEVEVQVDRARTGARAQAEAADRLTAAILREAFA